MVYRTHRSNVYAIRVKLISTKFGLNKRNGDCRVNKTARVEFVFVSKKGSVNPLAESMRNDANLDTKHETKIAF